MYGRQSFKTAPRFPLPGMQIPYNSFTFSVERVYEYDWMLLLWLLMVCGKNTVCQCNWGTISIILSQNKNRLSSVRLIYSDEPLKRDGATREETFFCWLWRSKLPHCKRTCVMSLWQEMQEPLRVKRDHMQTVSKNTWNIFPQLQNTPFLSLEEEPKFQKKQSTLSNFERLWVKDSAQLCPGS